MNDNNIATSCKSILKRIYDLLTSPFRTNLAVFFILAVFSMAALVLWAPEAFRNPQNRNYWGISMFWNWGMAWLLTLPMQFFKRKAGRIYQVILFTITGLVMVGGIICVYVYKLPFNREMAAIVHDTNAGESMEFLSAYFNFSLVLVCLAALLIGIGGYMIIRKLRLSFGKRMAGVGLLFTLCSFGVMVARPLGYFDTITGQIYSIATIRPCPDLREHITAATVEVSGERPDKIVVVIGESLNRNRMSLYGYRQPTTPRLEALRDSTLRMIVFTDVTAPANHTKEAFRCFMSTFNEGSETPWYDCTSIPEVLNKGGYYTRWLSNQGMSGEFDGEAAAYGHLCNSTSFLTYSYMVTPHYDEALLHLVDSLGQAPKTPSVDFLHLLGSHTRYDMRYPAGREKFKADDYGYLPEGQRDLVSQYDNSVVYNDSVVCEIYHRYAGDDAIMLYFSDHGQDLFDTDEKYHGHARAGDADSEAAGRRIPMLFIYTDEFGRKHPQTVRMLEAMKDRHFNTTDLIYLLSRIAALDATYVK